MAITRCTACGARMSTLAKACPACGVEAADAPAHGRRRPPRFLANLTLHYTLAAILFVVGGLLYMRAWLAFGRPPALSTQVMLYVGLAWYVIARAVSWFRRGS